MALLALATPLTANDQSKSAAVPGRIDAHYAVTLGAFNLGHFKFEQRRAGDTYTLKSVVELSALLGAFEWRGITKTSGSLTDGKPSPARYAFDYRSKGRGGLVRMEFDKGNVVGLAAVPSQSDGAGMVPLKKHHTHAVFDPLSAILHLAQAEGKNPCGRTLPVFDGKQRFNLTFNFLRHERVPGARLGQQLGIVCQIKYTPLGGYANNSDTRRFAQEKNIEIAFRPVSSGQLMVPYRLSLPTIIGTARLDLQKLSVGHARSRVAHANQ